MSIHLEASVLLPALRQFLTQSSQHPGQGSYYRRRWDIRKVQGLAHSHKATSHAARHQIQVLLTSEINPCTTGPKQMGVKKKKICGEYQVALAPHGIMT